MLCHAHAKINLGLRILGRRPDGYHEIETLFQEISLHDTLEAHERPRGITLSCSRTDLPVNEKNLVYRAAALLQRTCGVEIGCDLALEKRIPMGAGLGGGSSDAAAALKSLNLLWQLGLSQARLLELAGQLGSDVPFFILGGAALGRGRGEQLQPVRIFQDYWGVLIYPNLYVSTQWVYHSGTFDLTKSMKSSKLHSLTSYANAPAEWETALINDLQPVVFQKYPHLQLILRQLKEHGAFHASMSGSGSSLFGLFAREDQAMLAMQQTGSSYASYLFQPVSPSSRG
jgi:4-diphosphocytidyl-2-C-methyl-D-erythritol kinase